MKKERPFYRKYRHRSCSVCGSSQSRRLFRQEFSVMTGGNLLTGYDVVVCLNCGFCFADRIPGQLSFDRYYRDMSKYEYQETSGRESTHDLQRFRSIAEFVIPFLPDVGTRLLDVGCATGGLLSLFKDSGFTDVTGIDPSTECKKTAERLYSIQLLNIPLSGLPGQGLTFDCILLSGVLEHIRDIEKVLVLLGGILRPDGMVFIEVPDAAAFAKWPDAPYQEFSIEHINFFSEMSLQNLMRRFGFTVVSCVKALRHQTDSTVMPVITALFRKTEVRDSFTPVSDIESENGLVAYIKKSENIELKIRHVINSLVEKRTPLAIWGVGTHTLRLLATSQLLNASIYIFVDSNPHYQEKTLHGIPIKAPDALIGRGEAILISSRVHQTEIVRLIRQDLHLDNEIITLYEI